MKKIIFVLAFALTPFAVFAAGDHAGHSAHEADSDSAAGKPVSSKAKVTRTVQVSMNDAMNFDPKEIKVKAGETIRFSITNKGKLEHEFLIGTDTEIKEHAEMMRKMPNMKHDDGGSITLKPDQQGALFWKFTKTGNFKFACTIPGHLEAGMSGNLIVAK